jgi:hypothetical protein
MDQDEVDRLKRTYDAFRARFEAMCREHKLSPEQRQQLEEKFEMDALVVQEKAREIAQCLESDNPGDRLTAALLINDRIREEILGLVMPVMEPIMERIESLEARLANAGPEITALVRAEIDRNRVA